MLVLLLAIQIASTPPAPERGTGPVDTLIVDALSKHRPNVVTMRKWRTVTAPDSLAPLVSRLRANGFFEISNDSLDRACGNLGDSVNRLRVRVHDDSGWRELVLPERCVTSSEPLKDEVLRLRDVAWDALAGHVRGAHKKPDQGRH